MKRRDFIALVSIAAAGWPRAAEAQENYQHLIPFLIDLPGWTGPQPVGSDKGRRGDRVISAVRSYVRGDARFHASIMLGTAAAATSGARIDITVSRVRETTSTIDGFPVTTQSSPVFVLIAITLSPNAVFSLIFNNVSEDEAMAIARKFDWKRMQAQLNG